VSRGTSRNRARRREAGARPVPEMFRRGGASSFPSVTTSPGSRLAYDFGGAAGSGRNPDARKPPGLPRGSMAVITRPDQSINRTPDTSRIRRGGRAMAEATRSDRRSSSSIGEALAFPCRWRERLRVAATVLKRSGMEPSISSGVKGGARDQSRHQGRGADAVCSCTISPRRRDPDARRHCPCAAAPAIRDGDDRTLYGPGQVMRPA